MVDFTKLFKKKEVLMEREEAISYLKVNGYWEPPAGTKARTWPYRGAVAFAIDLEMIEQPQRAVHSINQERDIAYYENPDKAIAAGNLVPSLKGRTFVIVRR